MGSADIFRRARWYSVPKRILDDGGPRTRSKRVLFDFMLIDKTFFPSSPPGAVKIHWYTCRFVHLNDQSQSLLNGHMSIRRCDHCGGRSGTPCACSRFHRGSHTATNRRGHRPRAERGKACHVPAGTTQVPGADMACSRSTRTKTRAWVVSATIPRDYSMLTGIRSGVNPPWISGN